MQQYNATQIQKNPAQDEMFTHTLNPVAWDDAINLAKRFCRTIAKKGGTPVQAVKSYGISDLDAPLEKWETAEEIIALAICKPAHRQAC